MLDFEKSDGLVPAVAQDHGTGEVLMMGFMNRESWERTLATGIVHYWSRSRKRLWQKGESSGNVQVVREIRVDCDGDCVLLRVRQVGGAACHTGYRSCFYRRLDGQTLVIDGERLFDPADKYGPDPASRSDDGVAPGGHSPADSGAASAAEGADS